MILSDLFHANPSNTGYLVWNEGAFVVQKKKPRSHEENRETRARLYLAYVALLTKKGLSELDANASVRMIWKDEFVAKKWSQSLPSIVGEDGFLRGYASGEALSLEQGRRLYERVQQPFQKSSLAPIELGWNSLSFYDVDATPQGILPKLSRRARLKNDEELLAQVREDFVKISSIEDSERKILLTLGVLSHGAAYRELDGRNLKIPHFFKQGELVTYTCYQHLIADGLKTISMVPRHADAPSIYICQGTELWPSQPSALGSIASNFALHGAATAAYAHSWRRIHRHLRELNRPYVAGHSMGGSLAMQIGLYSHALIQKAYAFNPPMPNERDHALYNKKIEKDKEKIVVISNLDDFAFWRMGSSIIGKVTLFFGNKRWRYEPIGLWDAILIFPAFIKFIVNVQRAFPAHQKIVALSKSWVAVRLSQQEIDQENRERVHRFDYLKFFPKLYDPLQILLRVIRRLFRWNLEEEFLHNEVEILALHERDLLDTLTEENRTQIEKELEEIKQQKQHLLSKL